MHLRDRLLEQNLLTVNLLLPSHSNLFLSAKAKLQGVFYFNQPPIAPTLKRVEMVDWPRPRALLMQPSMGLQDAQ